MHEPAREFRNLILSNKGASLVSDPPAKGLVREREGGASTL